MLGMQEGCLVKENKKTEEVAEYEELKKVISAVDEVMENTALLDNIKSEKELEQVMPVLLASLGKYAQAERSYIFELKPGSMDVLHMTHVWCAEGISPTVAEQQDIPLSIVPNWFSILNKEGLIVSYDTKRDGEKWPQEHKLFSEEGVESLILLPLISSGMVTGYMGIDNPDPKRVELAVRLLKGISGHISGLKENLHMMKKLEENLLNALYVVRKIDQEKKKEIEYKQQLMETAEDARRANMAKTDFLRRMSHDIRTPINGIQGMIAIAEHFPDDPEKQEECREKVKEASGFLLDLVNNILDMNKLESGAIVLEHKSFDLLEVLREINDIAKMNAGFRGLKISVDNTKIKHCHLIGSPLHLKQILQNIEGNAVKYNREGGSISFSASEIACANGMVTYRFVCTDTGRGMSKEFLAHAFEPFAQEDSSARTAYMGTGLGLPIAKQLAEMMGGTIEVESEQNVGTTFEITIPFEVDTAYENGDTPEQSVTEGDVSGVKVLLVEDNELNMEIARFILENAGMEVTTAFNGKEAVDTFASSKEDQFDLILMDVLMPVMDGLTATRTIRAMKRKDAQKIPIFAMTANAFTDDIKESRAAGMNEHLSKPLDEAKMMSVIKRYVAR